MKTIQSRWSTRFGRLGSLFLSFQLIAGQLGAAVDRPRTLQSQVADRAVLFLPSSLRELIQRHRDSFEEGVKLVLLESLLSPLGRTDLEDQLRHKLTATVRSLDTKPRFIEVAKNLGIIASMVFYLSLPEGDRVANENLQLILDYGAQATDQFPMVVYDRLEPPARDDSWQHLIEAIRTQRSALSMKYSAVRAQISSEHSQEGMSARSPLFGISSLLFSHSVNNVARAWCSVWKAANGDMAGMPAIP
jgi:hypothetical protein